MKRAPAVLALILAAGCLGTRDRLEPPRVTLAVTQTTVPGGSNVSGTISAADAGGIVLVTIQVDIEGDTNEPEAGFWRARGADTVHYPFSLPVRSGFTSGTPVYITATVQDNENFIVTKKDTIAVR